MVHSALSLTSDLSSFTSSIQLLSGLPPSSSASTELASLHKSMVVSFYENKTLRIKGAIRLVKNSPELNCLNTLHSAVATHCICMHMLCTSQRPGVLLHSNYFADENRKVHFTWRGAAQHSASAHRLCCCCCCSACLVSMYVCVSVLNISICLYHIFVINPEKSNINDHEQCNTHHNRTVSYCS